MVINFLLAGAGLLGGFVVGFLWGSGARSAMSDNVKTDVSGGIITVQLDATASLLEGLGNIL